MRTSSNSILPNCTFYISSINVITPLIFNIRQLFNVLLPDFLSIIHTYFHHLALIFKTTNPKQLTTIITRINFLHRFSKFLIYSLIYLLVSFFTSQYFFLSSSFRFCFQILNNSLSFYTKPHSHLYSNTSFKMRRFAFSTNTDFTRNI